MSEFITSGKVEKDYELFVVPWANAKQFKKVSEYLFSPELVKKRWALDQISVWESRCHPSLPAAIDATYGLTSAIVQDILWTNCASVNQQLDIQYMYSSAITRFVNLTVEPHRKPGTMSNLAKGLGIPSYIVDLRNEASHSMRPSLSCLRIAADTAMKFLKESYWDVESSKVENFVQKPIDAIDIRQLLRQFLQSQLYLRYAERKMRKEGDSEKRVPVEVKKILPKIEACIRRDKRLFIKVLVSEGVFIPHDDDFKKFVNEEDFLQFQKDEDPAKYVSDYDTSVIPKVPSSHAYMWFKILSMLNKYDSIPMFLEALLKTQGDRTVIGQKLLISWVKLILRTHAIGGRVENSIVIKLLKRKGIVVNWQSMFYAAVANPCKYVAFVIPIIFSNLDLHREAVQRILNLVAIHLGQANDGSFSICKNPTIFTLEKLKQSKKLQIAKRKKMKGECVKSIWSLVSDDAYKTWPIGHVINPIEHEDNEKLDEDNYDDFLREDFKEKFIHINNENDNEDDVSMDCENSDTLEKDSFEEIDTRKSFLYKK